MVVLIRMRPIYSKVEKYFCVYNMTLYIETYIYIYVKTLWFPITCIIPNNNMNLEISFA